MIQGWPWYALHFRENGLKWFFFLQNCTASSFSICNWKHLVIRSVFIPIPKKGNDKEYSSCCTIALISHTRKVMLKILQVHMNCELPNVQEGFKKMQRNQRSNCQHPLDHWKSKRVPEKHLFLLYWLCQSLWLCSVQFSSVTQSCPTLCDPMNHSTSSPVFLMMYSAYKLNKQGDNIQPWHIPFPI